MKTKPRELLRFNPGSEAAGMVQIEMIFETESSPAVIHVHPWSVFLAPILAKWINFPELPRDLRVPDLAPTIDDFRDAMEVFVMNRSEDE